MTNDDQLQEYKSYVRFTDDDEQNLRALAPTAIPLIPDIINSFYEALLDNPAARAVFSGGDEQVERLRAILGNWLKELFVRTQDEDYILSRRRIGKIHLEIGLPQRFMILGIDLMWQGICMTLRNAASKDPQLEQKLDSLHKRLTIDQAIMLESYKQLDATRIRRAERDALKEQLTRAEHLAEVGQLAASLAHEIKNPLAGISGAIQVIRDALGLDNEHRGIVDEILVHIARVDATVKDLLHYARPAPPARRLLKLSDVIRSALTLVSQEPATRGIIFKVNEADDDATIFADENQIEQLLINLLQNAAHASSGGDPIEVRTMADVAVDGPQGTTMMCIEIQDFGSGMPPEAVKRALEPFFTTKARGTGLGLAICRRICESHEGSISIKSEEKVGTTVRVLIPATPVT